MKLNIDQALSDPALLGQFVQNESWRSWRCFLRAFFGLKPVRGDKELFTQCTGRTVWPEKASKEGWLLIGVRAGKSFITALVSTFLAIFREYQLTPGEKGYILIVSPTKKQSSVVKRYLSSFFHDNDFLRPYLLRETAEEIELSNNVIIAVLSSDYKSLRGFTAIAGIIDEICFLDIEGQKPDVEVIRSLRSRLITTGGPLICISSPYWQRGSMYETYKRHYGVNDSNILVWQAGSSVMNPLLDKAAIQAAREEDPIGAISDYDAEFRSDISAFIPEDWLEGAVVRGRFELLPSGFYYRAFCDPSGGAHDSMVLSIGHRENDKLIQDVLKEKRAPFDPSECVKEFCHILKEYHVAEIFGDRYSGEWCAEAFKNEGIYYKPIERAKSDLYLNWIPLMARGVCEILDNRRLYDQIRRLERKASRSGKDIVDHPVRSGAMDDLSNCTAGLFGLLSQNLSDGTGDFEIGQTSPLLGYDRMFSIFDLPIPSGGWGNEEI
jgi:hypothetical protein